MEMVRGFDTKMKGFFLKITGLVRRSIHASAFGADSCFEMASGYFRLEVRERTGLVHRVPERESVSTR